MRTTRARVLAVFVTAAAVLLPSTSAGAAPSHTLIVGSGSTWSSNAVNQWVADVQTNGLRVVFTPNGSAQGRKDFAYKTTDFGVTDIGYQGVDPVSGDPDTSLGRQFAYLPIVAGGTAFPYQVKVAGKMVRNLRLSGQTIAKIFTNHITNWNDAAITADNNGRKLPSIPIIPVVHSEGSGSTAQFTRYLNSVYPSIWNPFLGANSGTEYFPRKGKQIAQNGSDAVMSFVSSKAANGAIGYDEYSYALGKNYPVAKVLNKAGYYTLPNQYNVAVALTQAIINGDKNSPNYLLQDLKNVYVFGDSRAYPLSSYSYSIIPTAADDSKMTSSKRQTLADFLFYSVCGGQKEMGPIGYSPLPLNLVKASFDQIGKLKTADPSIDISKQAPSTCNNPTFDKTNPSRNYLAEIAPKPPACDKQGAGPCVAGTDTGTSNPQDGHAPPPNGSSDGSGNGSNSNGGTHSAAAGSGSPTPTASGSIDPVTGQLVGNDSGGSDDVAANPTDLSAYSRKSNDTPYAILAVALLLVVLVAPPILAQRLAKRPKDGS
ncbi:MAG TPA: substrate-binding domain-containing protein [Jatrophihabitantaceae bacterium]|nr:substrate-binding domain-containing protein [Jatrophihabitantaceae bacterium]